MKLIIGITGATGVIYGVRLLERLREARVESHLVISRWGARTLQHETRYTREQVEARVESHLVISRWGARTLQHETRYTREQVEALATVAYKPDDLGAAISSGSFATAGMIVAPCSAKTLAAIANGYSDSLIHRAADVVMKERRPLLLALREAPLSAIHLENMLKLARLGVVMFPPVPAFYNNPASLDEVVDYTVARMLDHFGVTVAAGARWSGEMNVEGHR